MFVKLSELNCFTVKSVSRPIWKLWQDGKMLESDIPVKGYREEYKVDTDKGTLGLSSNQLAQLLLACNIEGKSDIIGRTFSVRNNGKTGMEIRYFFNLSREQRIENVAKNVKEVFGGEEIDDFEPISTPF